MLYLGDKDFAKTYKELDKQKRWKFEEERKKRKEEKRRNKANDETVIDDDDIKPDKEEIFLRQVPGMKVVYRNCKEIIRRRSQQPGYDKSQHGLYVQYGSYKVPTCCSVLVNLLQFILTVCSVVMQKGDPAAFWQPAIYSQGVMKTNFYAV